MTSTLTPLRFVRTDNGNCRVYYQSSRDANRMRDSRLYCFQAGHKRGTFELHVCTRDGEPSFPISHSQYAIDRWPDDSSTTAIEFAVWASENVMPTTEEQDQ